jgi:NitT/TauT family transport system permease protein
MSGPMTTEQAAAEPARTERAGEVTDPMATRGAAAELRPDDFLDPDDLSTIAAPARSRRSVVTYVAPLAVFAVVIGIWLFLSEVVLDKDRRFLLPPPQDVVSKGILDSKNLTEILQGLWSTVEVALVGLAVAMVLGVGLAILMSQARWVERSIYPYAVALQTIPILAIVPLLGFWFGFEFRSRVIVCVLIALFPIITNTLFGLQSTDPAMLDLFRLHKANRRQRLWRLQLPAALPAMMTGFKISAGLSVIGAIIADFFFRQGDPGIGRLIDVYRMRLATEQLLTALFFSSLVGLLLFWLFDLIGRRIERRRTKPRVAARR